MKSVPVDLVAEFRGLARAAGSFTSDDGEQVSYGEAYRFEFEQPDGTLDDVTIAAKRLDTLHQDGALKFDPRELKRGDQVRIQGTAGSGERGLYLRPHSITKATSADLKAVSA